MDRVRLDASDLADLFAVPIATGPISEPTPERPRVYWSLMFGLAILLGSAGTLLGYGAVMLTT